MLLLSTNALPRNRSRQFAPAEGYDYHPLMPAPDAENAIEGAGEVSTETTCSICMEEVNTHPDPADGPLLNLNARRSYAVAPCHHLFHTKCLQQWMAVKVSSPVFLELMPDHLPTVQAAAAAALRRHSCTSIPRTHTICNA